MKRQVGDKSRREPLPGSHSRKEPSTDIVCGFNALCIANEAIGRPPSVDASAWPFDSRCDAREIVHQSTVQAFPAGPSSCFSSSWPSSSEVMPGVSPEPSARARSLSWHNSPFATLGLTRSSKKQPNRPKSANSSRKNPQRCAART